MIARVKEWFFEVAEDVAQRVTEIAARAVKREAKRISREMIEDMMVAVAKGVVTEESKSFADLMAGRINVALSKVANVYKLKCDETLRRATMMLEENTCAVEDALGKHPLDEAVRQLGALRDDIKRILEASAPTANLGRLLHDIEQRCETLRRLGGIRPRIRLDGERFMGDKPNEELRKEEEE